LTLSLKQIYGIRNGGNMKLNFKFDGNMSREVLESYLSRAVTAGSLFESETLEDDLRAIKRLGVKFIGRAS